MRRKLIVVTAIIVLGYLLLFHGLLFLLPAYENINSLETWIDINSFMLREDRYVLFRQIKSSIIDTPLSVFISTYTTNEKTQNWKLANKKSSWTSFKSVSDGKYNIAIAMAFRWEYVLNQYDDLKAKIFIVDRIIYLLQSSESVAIAERYWEFLEANPGQMSFVEILHIIRKYCNIGSETPNNAYSSEPLSTISPTLEWKHKWELIVKWEYSQSLEKQTLVLLQLLESHLEQKEPDEMQPYGIRLFHSYFPVEILNVLMEINLPIIEIKPFVSKLINHNNLFVKLAILNLISKYDCMDDNIQHALTVSLQDADLEVAEKAKEILRLNMK